MNQQIFIDNDAWTQHWTANYVEYKTCTRCLYNEKTPAITFYHHGVCDYCILMTN